MSTTVTIDTNGRGHRLDLHGLSSAHSQLSKSVLTFFIPPILAENKFAGEGDHRLSQRTKSLVSSTTTTTDKEKTGDSGSLDEAKSGDSDSDDDGDGTLTRDEENYSPDQNPANDVTNSEVGADYLNPEVNSLVPATAYREHTIYETYVITMTINNISLPNISQDVFNFGTLSNSALSTSRKITPDF